MTPMVFTNCYSTFETCLLIKSRHTVINYFNIETITHRQ